ncbi:hypothetical protein C0J52_20019, partial [Blattella germanica]
SYCSSKQHFGIETQQEVKSQNGEHVYCKFASQTLEDGKDISFDFIETHKSIKKTCNRNFIMICDFIFFTQPRHFQVGNRNFIMICVKKIKS